MNEDQFLKSDRLVFRHWKDTDLDLATELWGDIEVTKLIGGLFSKEKIQQRLETEINLQKEHGVQYWPIFLLDTGDHIGCCGLRPYKPEEGIYELGFHIKHAYWGKGYATEAAKAVIDYAFNKLKVKGLFAGHNPSNKKSAQVLEKLGFEYTHDEYYAPTGLNHPSYILRH